ncbi:MAG: hypothetical protein ACE5E4_13270, partial [Candidatus Binatia bacterium]
YDVGIAVALVSNSRADEPIRHVASVLLDDVAVLGGCSLSPGRQAADRLAFAVVDPGLDRS